MGSTAALSCALAAALLAGACADSPRGGTRVLTLSLPSAEEPECAWFGDARGGTLYFGIASFWPTFRAAGGDPRADLARTGPQRLGRFDLENLRHLPPVDLGEPEAASGVWDVLAHPNGRVYFASFFGLSGWVEPETGRVGRFAEAGPGLVELAADGGGDLLASRYGDADGGNGSVVWLNPEGRVLAEYPLAPPAGFRVAAKSVARDPLRDEIWVNTDLLPRGEGPARHDVRILDRDGVETVRFERPEVQFMTFAEDGTGFFAEVDGPLLTLRIRAPERAGRALLTGLVVPLDDAFDPGLDFVQDVKLAEDGTAVVTRWSGRVHLVRRDGRTRTVSLPRSPDGPLYYTGVLEDGNLCVTLCAEVTVVCRALGGQEYAALPRRGSAAYDAAEDPAKRDR